MIRGIAGVSGFHLIGGRVQIVLVLGEDESYPESVSDNRLGRRESITEHVVGLSISSGDG